MKKLIFIIIGVLFTFSGFTQEIGNFQQLATIKRNDTIDVIFQYKPDTTKDIRSFQIDFQFKKELLTHVSTTVDNTVSTMTPAISYNEFDNYKYDSYNSATGVYNYITDTNWTVSRNYLLLSSGNKIVNDIYIIHNKFIINNVRPNFDEDSVHVNWARLFKKDGTSIGDNMATLTYKKMDLELLGNLVISGNVELPPTMKGNGKRPTVICTKLNTGEFISSALCDTAGNYSLINVDKNTKYKLLLRFPIDSMETFRDYAVTISDAVKTYDEFTLTDVNQNYSKQYLKYGLSYLIADMNQNGKLDGGDPYLIYANVSGLQKINTSTMIRTFHANVYDSLVLGTNQWNEWSNYLTATNFITDTINTTNIVVNIKYFIQGDVDRTHSSRIWNKSGAIVANAVFKGRLDVDIPNTYAAGNQPLYVPFNINTNGDNNYGLQFEMKYDKDKVKFEEIISNFNGGPWLQYVTHDEAAGTIRFGGMNNQFKNGLNGQATPFKLRFSPVGNTDIVSNIQVRQLMDASDENGDHLNINLNNQIAVLMYKKGPSLSAPLEEITASIRPNPTTGWFELEVKFPEPDMAMNVAIYDVKGRLVQNAGTVETNFAEKIAYKQIDLTSATNGNYYLILNNSNKQLTKQFIKV
jgi:hypothetical protein